MSSDREPLRGETGTGRRSDPSARTRGAPPTTSTATPGTRRRSPGTRTVASRTRTTRSDWRGAGNRRSSFAADKGVPRRDSLVERVEALPRSAPVAADLLLDGLEEEVFCRRVREEAGCGLEWTGFVAPFAAEPSASIPAAAPSVASALREMMLRRATGSRMGRSGHCSVDPPVDGRPRRATRPFTRLVTDTSVQGPRGLPDTWFVRDL